MIKKTLRNAAVGTLAAGAMILPATTTIAPSLQLVACNYPGARDTSTEQILSEYVIRKGKVRSTVTVRNLDGDETPNGVITVTQTGPGRDKTKSKVIRGDAATRVFTFGGFGKKKQGLYTFNASFEGFCRFALSSDQDHLVVDRDR